MMDEMEEVRRLGSSSALIVNLDPWTDDECPSAHISLASSSVSADVFASSVCKELFWIHDPRFSPFPSVRHSFPGMQGVSDRAIRPDL